MACFLVPAGEAVVTTVVQKVVKKKEKQEGKGKSGLTWSRRLGWLNKMLWGGSILLALEHIWHGEVVPWPPFLTAIGNPGEVSTMLREMAIYGGTMAAVITIIWLLMVLVVELKTRPVLGIKAAQVKGSG